jgi:leader peptidase (prepilin peptidase)/N-methyltransferase
MPIALAALLGYIVGIFLNLCADFLPATPRLSPFRLPRCHACGTQRRALSLAGILADLLGRSRCPQCGTGRRLRAPLVEIGTAAVFAFLAWRYGLTVQFAFMAPYFSALILILVTDLEHRLILDVVTVPVMALALAGSFFMPNMTPVKALIGGAVAALPFFLVALVYGLITRREGFGLGDIMLLGFIGLATGFPVVLVAVIAAILLGALIALVLLAARRAGLKTGFPYGPALILGGALALLYGREILLWYLAPYMK